MRFPFRRHPDRVRAHPTSVSPRVSRERCLDSSAALRYWRWNPDQRGKATVSTDKRERRRVKRVRMRKAHARHEAQQREAAGRRFRGIALVAAAERAFGAGAYDEAVEHAARAVRLAPHDKVAAALYVNAAERSRVPEHRLAALEHYVRTFERSFQVVVSLAALHRELGNLDRARAFAAEARANVPRLLPRRRVWLALLDEVERATAKRDSRPEPASPAAGQASLPFDHAGSLTAKTPDSPPLASPVRQTERAAPSWLPATDGASDAPSAPVLAPDFTVPVSFTPDILGLDALRKEPANSLDEVRLAQQATKLRDAESFDRLLAVERAQGLIRLSHQEETARKVLSVFLGRALLADEVGLGKTIEAGLVLAEYFLRGRAQSALILVPPTLVRQWREELATKFGIETGTTEDARFRTAPEEFWSGSGVVVASLATARSERHREGVTGRPWDLVIVDEAHTLKNHRTESYALVQRLQSRFLLLLTATPVENRVEELYNLISLIRPGHLGGRAAFVRRFGGSGGRLSETARNEIRSLLSELMIRNTRALSGVQLPPRFARTLLVEPGPDEDAVYAQLATALRSLGIAGRARTLLSTLLQEAGSSPWAVRGTLEKARADAGLPDAVRAAVAEASDAAHGVTGSEKSRVLLQALQATHGPTVVFTRFRGTLSFLSHVLQRAGVAHECVHGEIPAAGRAAAIERCRETGAVLLSTDVGSEGLNLQFCHRLINFDLPWNPMRIEQRIGRLHRIGQDHPVEVLNFCLAGSIEERILQILDERINLFELVVGEVEMILGYLDGTREFSDQVLEAFAEGDEAERTRSFARIADALAAARERYRAVKAFDEALFRNELGV
jgi:superfamily II DNA or RNA helicase